MHRSYYYFLQKWDLKKAYQHLQNSFEKRPTVEYYQSMASILVAERKTEAATNYIKTALQIDPFSAINHHLQGFIYYVQERYDPAIKQFNRALELNSDFMASNLYKGQALILAGKNQEGLSFFEGLPSERQDYVMKIFLNEGHRRTSTWLSKCSKNS